MTGKNHPLYGKHRSAEVKKKISESRMGEKNPMQGRTGALNPAYGKKYWLGKKHSKKNRENITRGLIKYYRENGIFGDSHACFNKKAVKILERHLNRTIVGTGLIVHHIDGNYKNNSVENLRLMTRPEHSRLHRAWEFGARYLR